MSTPHDQASSPKPQATGPAWKFPPKVVLVAVDFGDASARAAALAGAVATAFGARLSAIHAERFDPPPYLTLEQITRLEAERRLSATAAASHLAQFVAAATPWPVEARIADEPPVDAILHAATSADLIVVGTHGRSGPGRWWLGSVAERIVRGAAVPVLVTRAGGAAAPVGFDRIVLVGEGIEPASDGRLVAQGLADAFKGRVIPGGSVTRCQPDVMEGASLVVMEMGSSHSAWSITDPVAKVLGACERPVLFMPPHQQPTTKN